jgi:hypothetical protein
MQSASYSLLEFVGSEDWKKNEKWKLRIEMKMKIRDVEGMIMVMYNLDAKDARFKWSDRPTGKKKKKKKVGPQPALPFSPPLPSLPPPFSPQPHYLTRIRQLSDDLEEETELWLWLISNLPVGSYIDSACFFSHPLQSVSYLKWPRCHG